MLTIWLIIYVLSKQSNPSGDALTTIINNIYNMFYVRYVYVKQVSDSLNNFHEFVDVTVYGDDNVLSVSDAIIDKYNMLTFEKVLGDIGLTYTAADKGDIIKGHVEEHEVVYLKRHFKKLKDINYYIAPLDFMTVMEIPRWSQGDPLSVVDQMARFNTCLMHLANHNEEVFLKTREIFRGYCNDFRSGKFKINNEKVILLLDANELFTYRRCLNTMHPEIFKPLVDLASCLPKGHDVLQLCGSR